MLIIEMGIMTLIPFHTLYHYNVGTKFLEQDFFPQTRPAQHRLVWPKINSL